MHSMRGSNTLFADIFHNTDSHLPAPKQRKGRSADLIEKRNDLLIHRYVFYSQITPRLNYDFIIERLSEEVFLSPITIPEIIAVNRGKIHVLRKNDLTRHYFEKRYPFLVWEPKQLLSFA